MAPWYFGTDTNNAWPMPDCGEAAHFYVGRLGGERNSGGGGFDEAAASSLPHPEHVYGYWDLAGPGSAPIGMTYTEWGAGQAEAFYETWLRGTVSARAKGRTLFLDIEPENGGWRQEGTMLDFGFNRDVLYGALRHLNQGVLDITPGIYISLSTWDLFFGRDYQSPLPFVLWLGGTTCPGDCAEAVTEFPARAARGGCRTMIWQYQVPGCFGSYQDLNLTPYNGFMAGKWHPTPDR